VSVTWAIDAGDGVRGVGLDVVVPAASTVKPLIAVALWRDVLAGRIDPSEPVPAGYPLAGGNSLLDVLPGIGFAVRHACTLMLAVSDNTASNLLLERLGYDRVNAEAAALGLEATSLQRLFMDAEAVAAGRENRTSARDLVRLLRAIGVPGVLAEEVRRPVLEALGASQHMDVLGQVVDEERLLGAKSGSHERALHDTGLVDAPGGPVAVAVCSSPRASWDALRATARDALAPYLV
jgi:beta-lactamase class A